MPLTLPEELLLLMLDDETGQLIDRAAPSGDYALVAAILAELRLQGRIERGAAGITVLNPAPTGDAAMDDVLARLGAATEAQDTYISFL